jgi:hypothetical protein
LATFYVNEKYIQRFGPEEHWGSTEQDKDE